MIKRVINPGLSVYLKLHPIYLKLEIYLKFHPVYLMLKIYLKFHYVYLNSNE